MKKSAQLDTTLEAIMARWEIPGLGHRRRSGFHLHAGKTFHPK